MALTLLAGSIAGRAGAGCEGEVALRRAALDADADAVRVLLERGVAPDPSRACPYYRTALDIASERGHLEVVRTLVAHDARLFYASAYALGQRDDPELVAAIVEGAPAAQRAQLRNDALAAACQRGRSAVVRTLLEAGADPNAGHPRTGGPAPLPAAARGRDHELLLALLEAGANATSEALNEAAAAGNVDSVRVLLERGADPHQPDTDGNALSLTAATSNPTRAEALDAVGALLLERGVDPNVMYRGKLPLSWAREHRYEALAMRLADAGARGGTSMAYKLERAKKAMRSAAYMVVLLFGGGH
jgi:ankyrin repeat protein